MSIKNFIDSATEKAIDLIQDGKVVKKIANVSAKQAAKVLSNEKVLEKN